MGNNNNNNYKDIFENPYFVTFLLGWLVSGALLTGIIGYNGYMLTFYGSDDE